MRRETKAMAYLKIEKKGVMKFRILRNKNSVIYYANSRVMTLDNWFDWLGPNIYTFFLNTAILYYISRIKRAYFSVINFNQEIKISQIEAPQYRILIDVRNRNPLEYAT